MKRNKKKRLEDLEESVYNLQTTIGFLLQELGYTVDYSLEWNSVEGIKKIEKEKKK